MKFAVWMAAFLSVGAGAVPALSFAGNEGSGGGNAVVCFTSPDIVARIRNPKNPDQGDILDSYISHVKSVEAFDLYQAKQPRGFAEKPTDIIPVNPGEGSTEYVEKIAARFDQYVPVLSEMIRGERNKFRETSVIWEDHGLRKVDDVNTTALIDSRNCVLATIAEQHDIGNATFLHLDRRLFQHRTHSALSRGVLTLHEVVYHQARMLKQEDSRNTRLLVSALISRNNGQTVSELLELVDSLGFGVYNPRRHVYPARVFVGLEEELRAVADLHLAQFEQDAGAKDWIRRANQLIGECLVGAAVLSRSSHPDPWESSSPSCETTGGCYYVIKHYGPQDAWPPSTPSKACSTNTYQARVSRLKAEYQVVIERRKGLVAEAIRVKYDQLVGGVQAIPGLGDADRGILRAEFQKYLDKLQHVAALAYFTRKGIWVTDVMATNWQYAIFPDSESPNLWLDYGIPGN